MDIITEETINDFKKYLYESEKSKNTIEKYMRDISRFSAFLVGKNLDKTTVLEYKRHLCENYSPRSVNSILSSLNMFFSHINRKDLKVKFLKIQRHLFADRQKELTKSEYERLLKAAKGKNERLYLLMQTVASTGLRVSEIKYITVDSVKSGQTTINCKGKIRQIFLPPKLCKMLKRYIRLRGIKSGTIFTAKSGKPLDRHAIWKMMKSLCDIAGVSKDKVFPHNLRHLFARAFYDLHKDIVKLADILGHSSVETTRIYTIESGVNHMIQLERLGLLQC